MISQKTTKFDLVHYLPNNDPPCLHIDFHRFLDIQSRVQRPVLQTRCVPTIFATSSIYEFLHKFTPFGVQTVLQEVLQDPKHSHRKSAHSSNVCKTGVWTFDICILSSLQKFHLILQKYLWKKFQTCCKIKE